MKILHTVNYPLDWAPGGAAIQIRRTIAELAALGVENEWLHHEAPGPAGDILHYWGEAPSDWHWQLARKQGLKIVASINGAPEGLPGHGGMLVRRWARKFYKKILSRGWACMAGLEFKRAMDALLVLNPYQRDYEVRVSAVPAGRIHVIPNGVDDVFVPDTTVRREPRLLMVGMIRRIKNQVALAHAARAAGVPVLFVGAPLATEQDYAEEFRGLVDDKHVKWIEKLDRAGIAGLMQSSAGLVLASSRESQSLVLMEALACETPVMSTRLPTVATHYGKAIRYSPAPGAREYARALKRFYDDCLGGLKQNFQVLRWPEVARRILDVYDAVLKAPTSESAIGAGSRQGASR